MPDGQVQWIDRDAGVAHIVRKGREFIAPLTDVATQARVPGARVHFDLTKTDGIDAAANVVPKRGKRTSRGHRRYADLTGARQPGAKVPSAAARQLGVDVTTQPMRVAGAWLEAQADGAIDDALTLYAPDAVIHGAEEQTIGRTKVRAKVADESATGFEAVAVDLTGVDDLIRVDWPAGTRFGTENPPLDTATSYLRIDHGQIVEQWDRVVPDIEVVETDDQQVITTIRGRLTDADRAYVTEHFERFYSRIQQPLLFVRLKMRVVDDPARERAVTASSTLDVDGQLVRAFVHAETATEAIDTLVKRLRTQLDRIGAREPSQPSEPTAADWHAIDPHSAENTAVNGTVTRAVNERELVRHKSYTTAEATVEEAAWDMALLDYDFFLFQELATGQDCLLAKGASGLVLLRLDDSAEVPPTGTCEVDVLAEAAPTLAVSAAIEHLNFTDAPFVYFRNEKTDRGNVAYRRLDGHYGLITPPEAQ